MGRASAERAKQSTKSLMWSLSNGIDEVEEDDDEDDDDEEEEDEDDDDDDDDGEEGVSVICVMGHAKVSVKRGR